MDNEFETKEMRIYNKKWDRNQKLAETDKYLLADYPISDEDLEKVKAYREVLRHLPEDENFPDVDIPELVL